MNAAAIPHVAALDTEALIRLCELSNDHWVVEAGDSLIGYALVFCDDHDYDGEEFLSLRAELGQSFVYIDQVVVAESSRGAGLGRQLYEVLERSAVARGCRWLCCEVNLAPPNPGSLGFHVKLGFEIVRELATQDGRTVALLKRAVPLAA